jgi:RNA polymerase sigma-70 factor, ECF subfamily
MAAFALASRSALDYSGLTDEELVMAHRAAGPAVSNEAVEELFRRYLPRTARWCRRFTQDRDSAHDLAQDILFRAYRGLDKWRGSCQFSTWLYVITRNHYLSLLRKRAAQPACIDSSRAELIPDRTLGEIHGRVEREQLMARRWQAMVKALTRTEATVMMLHYGEDVPLREITANLGLTNKSGAKAYIMSARRKLLPHVRRHRDRRALGA